MVARLCMVAETMAYADNEGWTFTAPLHIVHTLVLLIKDQLNKHKFIYVMLGSSD